MVWREVLLRGRVRDAFMGDSTDRVWRFEYAKWATYSIEALEPFGYTFARNPQAKWDILILARHGGGTPEVVSLLGMRQRQEAIGLAVPVIRSRGRS